MNKTNRQRLRLLISVFAALLLMTSQAFAQVQVKGKVTSDAGPEPGVIVFVKGNAGSGTMTDADGNYSLTVAGPNEILIFSLMGYKEQEVRVGNRTTINVQLEEDANLLEEVLVVGYGTQKKEFVVGSVSQVSSKDLLKAPNTNVSSMLAGRLAGMTAVQTTGIPGGEGAYFGVERIEHSCNIHNKTAALTRSDSERCCVRVKLAVCPFNVNPSVFFFRCGSRFDVVFAVFTMY